MMVNVVLGAKAKNYNFDVADVDLETLKGTNPDYTVKGPGEIIISQSKTDYVVLNGSFNLTRMMSGDYDGGVKTLNSITVVENGRVSYTASGLGIDGSELQSATAFTDFLASQGYTLKGNAYANVINAADYNDLIHGMSGNDKISGMGGVDRLFGDDGADRLFGGEGNDSLTGGTGADIFEFTVSNGDDVILDFQASAKGQDHIDLSGCSDVASFADLEITRVGKSVLIEFGDDSILLRGVALKDIGATDFEF
jgi:Ca2+-binding RTX toxin-like protein